jgi:hypothetical protein
LERNRKEAEMKHNQVCWLKLHWISFAF